MKTQHLQGKPISDDLSQVCILFDPKDGRVVHVHGSTMLHLKSGLAKSELETRARKHAEHFGKSVAGLKALHVPIAEVRKNGRLRVNKSGDGLVPSPPQSIRNRPAQTTAPRDRR
ncbi:MAG TPA: hypothetical protein VN823_11065 [Stellaceae bacterium]|nr:hypothetical protein [Stellaceae bacterium]